MRWPAVMRLTCIGILAQFALLLLAFGVLTYCFLISDFSVIYVAQHSYSLLSWELKLAAVWGGHEGSLLLWCCCFPPERAVCWHYRQQTDPLFPLTLAVLSLMLAALLLFVVLWSDPSCGYFHQQSKAAISIRCCNIPVLSSIRRCFISAMAV